MSRPSCPTCKEPIDPTHAPVARIRGAKIITFCSTACAAGKPEPATTETDKPARSIPKVAPPTPKPAKAAKATSLDDAWVTDDNFKLEPEPKAEPKAASVKAKDHSSAVVEKKPTKREASEPREVVVASDVTDVSLAPSGRKKTVIFVAAALVCGGAALAVIDGVSASGKEQATEAPMAAPPTAEKQDEPRPEAAEAPAAVDDAVPEVLYDRAVAKLAELRKSPSRRIKRLATMALARAGDSEALEGLRTLLIDEESSLNRIALAYALARSGDQKGREILISGLAHARRDVRVDAAIALLNLGDDAGRDTLNRMTNLRHYKISACGHLARAGDTKAKILLEKVYNDPSQDEETVLRAAVALGRAGDASVASFLQSTLEDGRFQVGAADALAALGNKAAIDPLKRQLETNAMRVRAALAIRRLGAKVPLEALGVALTEDDEVTLVTAAEATLILTGPKELAARD